MTGVEWIKLYTDMFDNRKIKHLRRLPEGDDIVLIWIMLLTLAGRCNSNGLIFLTENIPYTHWMLAEELGFDEDTITLALKELDRLNMVQKNADGMLAVIGWEEHQNIEGLERIREQNRLRKRKYDANQKLNSSSNVTGNVTGNVTVTQSNATEEEREEEKEIEIDCIPKRNTKADEDFQAFWDAYPAGHKVGKQTALKSFKKVKVPVETLVEALEKQKRSKQWTKEGGRYIPNPATWLNQGRWEDELETADVSCSSRDVPVEILPEVASPGRS